MGKFLKKFLETVKKQLLIYKPYQDLCKIENLDLDEIKRIINNNKLYKIPAVPAVWFKKNKSNGLFKQLANFELEGQWLISSSTSGDSSYTWRTKTDIDSIAQSFLNVYKKVPRDKSLAFSPDVLFLEKISKRFEIDEKKTVFYASVPAKAADDYFNMESLIKLDKFKTILKSIITKGKSNAVMKVMNKVILQEIKRSISEDRPIVFSSSIIALYPSLYNLNKNYNLGNNAYFLTGAGGWDGKKGTMEGNKLEKKQYVNSMCEKFSIPEEYVSTNFIDIYGTTENGKAFSGYYSRKYEDFLFEVTEDVKMYIIDPISGEPCKKGEKGYPRFLTYVGVEGFAGACIQQNDIVTAVDVNEDFSVNKFTNISRSPDSKSDGGVGCAYELVKGVES